MTNIKEVIHLYLGCEMTLFLKATEELGEWQTITPKTLIELDRAEMNNSLMNFEIRLRLRRLDSMTEEENIEFSKIDINKGVPKAYDLIRCDAARVTYLLKQGFWLFGDEAFEQGLIIDKNLKP